eukprot:gb/GECH01004934.1/.p1 GENE.gb/GECH01004934.1/~~gb/GECH01004934.1/.p1  ORF type:complete len:250 (+),score=50.58 gb/GECH01004934.1/:1-750(+)
MEVNRKLLGKMVFPGDIVGAVIKEKDKTESESEKNPVKIGHGLIQNQNDIIAMKAGKFKEMIKDSNRFIVENNQKRYVPSLEDMVIGRIVERHAEDYKVDIGGASLAVLPALAFDGATKRNKPNLKVGNLVYCRVVVANKDMDPELSCCSPVKARSWVTGESIFGELKEGYIFECSLGLCRQLLEGNCTVLRELGKIPFEIAVGMNGKVWINAKKPLEIVLITNAILNSEHMSDKHVKVMVKKLLEKTK